MYLLYEWVNFGLRTFKDSRKDTLLCIDTGECVYLEHVCCMFMHEYYIDRCAHVPLYTHISCVCEHMCMHALTAVKMLPAAGLVIDSVLLLFVWGLMRI